MTRLYCGGFTIIVDGTRDEIVVQHLIDGDERGECVWQTRVSGIAMAARAHNDELYDLFTEINDEWERFAKHVGVLA